MARKRSGRTTERRKGAGTPPLPDRYAGAKFFDPEEHRRRKEARRMQEPVEEPQPYADPALAQPPHFPGPIVIDGVCDECGETVPNLVVRADTGERREVRVHRWFCSWWDTEEGKTCIPF